MPTCVRLAYAVLLTDYLSYDRLKRRKARRRRNTRTGLVVRRNVRRSIVLVQSIHPVDSIPILNMPLLPKEKDKGKLEITTVHILRRRGFATEDQIQEMN